MRNERCATFSLFIPKAGSLSTKATIVKVPGNLSGTLGRFQAQRTMVSTELRRFHLDDTDSLPGSSPYPQGHTSTPQDYNYLAGLLEKTQ